MYSSLLVATWTQLFLLLFDLESSSQLSSSLSSWNSWCSKWSWNGWYQTNEEDCSIHHVWNSHCTTCLRVGACVNVPNLNLRIKINPVKQPIQSNSVGSWHTSHCGTSTFDNHFDYRLIGTSRKRAFFIDTLKGSPEISIPTCECSRAIRSVRSRRLWSLRERPLHWGLRSCDSVLSALCLARISWSTLAMPMLRSCLWFLWSLPTLVPSRSSPRKGRVSWPLSCHLLWEWLWFQSYSCLGSSLGSLHLSTVLERAQTEETRVTKHTAPLPCQHRSDVGGSWSLVKMWLQV